MTAYQKCEVHDIDPIELKPNDAEAESEMRAPRETLLDLVFSLSNCNSISIVKKIDRRAAAAVGQDKKVISN